MEEIFVKYFCEKKLQIQILACKFGQWHSMTIDRIPAYNNLNINTYT